MSKKPVNPILAALCGGLLAVLIAYGLAFTGMCVKAANVTAPDMPLERGAAAFSRVGLNLYAMQNVTLSGSGVVKSESGLDDTPSPVTDTVRLPLGVWVVLPMLAIFIGGYIAGALRRGSGALGVILPAVLAGVVYALVMYGISGTVKGIVHSSAIPVITNDVSFNPDPVLLKPQAMSALASTAILGIFFGLLGGMLASRGERREAPGKWWACGKAAVVTALIVQLLLGAGVWFAVGKIPDKPAATPLQSGAVAESQQPQAADSTTSAQQSDQPAATEAPKPVAKGPILAVSPMAVGLAYSAMYGARLEAQAMVLPKEGEATDLYSFKADLYGRRTQTSGQLIIDDTKKEPKDIKAGIVYAVIAIGALAAFAAGCLAVRWGSRDLAIWTALRVAVVWAAYLLAVGFFSHWGWGQVQTVLDIPTEISISVAPRFSAATTLCATAGVAISALIGACLTSLWYKSRRPVVAAER